MYLKQLIAVFLIVSGASALELPCARRNVTIQSGVNYRILVAPSQCGHVAVNETEFKIEPNLEHITPTNAKDKFTVMLLRPNPRDHNHFFLHWLISNITPFKNSLTANKTRTIFKNYAPLVAFDNATRYWLYVFKQNHNTGPVNYGYGLAPNELTSFSPDSWIKSHMPQIGSLVGGLEFNVKPARAPQARPTRPRPYYTTHRPGRRGNPRPQFEFYSTFSPPVSSNSYINRRRTTRRPNSSYGRSSPIIFPVSSRPYVDSTSRPLFRNLRFSTENPIKPTMSSAGRSLAIIPNSATFTTSRPIQRFPLLSASLKPINTHPTSRPIDVFPSVYKNRSSVFTAAVSAKPKEIYTTIKPFVGFSTVRSYSSNPSVKPQLLPIYQEHSNPYHEFGRFNRRHYYTTSRPYYRPTTPRYNNMRNNRTNTSYPNYPRPPPYNPNYPPPAHPAPMPQPPPHGGGSTVIINNPPAYNPNFPPPPPPAHPYNPQPNVVHHIHEKKKKGKGAASSIVAIFPLIIGLALGATQL